MGWDDGVAPAEVAIGRRRAKLSAALHDWRHNPNAIADDAAATSRLSEEQIVARRNAAEDARAAYVHHWKAAEGPTPRDIMRARGGPSVAQILREKRLKMDMGI